MSEAKLKSTFSLLLFRLIAGAMDRNINITISVYVPVQRFRSMFSKVKNKRYRKQLTKLGGNKGLRGKPRATMFVVSFVSFKSRESSGDRVMPLAEVRVGAQAFHGSITVLSHLKARVLNAMSPSDKTRIHLV